MTASSLLRSARIARGVSQRALAAAAGKHQPDVSGIERGADAHVSSLEALLRAAGHQLITIPATGLTAVAAADLIRQELAEAQEDEAFRWFIQLADCLADAEPATRVALCVAEPAPTGSKGYDALIAAVVEYRLQPELPVPVWTSAPSRYLNDDWFLESLPSLQEHARAHAPVQFTRRRAYLAASDLVSV